MISTDAWLQQSDTGARLIMQVHDELVLEVPAEHLPVVRSEIVALMSAAADLRVPLRVDAGQGANWDEAH
jgi:DNA polymerase-1